MTVRACVLSGGGVKGAWQIGALDAAYRLYPELKGGAGWGFIAGVSTGALSGALMAVDGGRIDRLQSIYEGIRGNSDIYDGSTNWLARAWHLWRWGAAHRPTGLEALIRKHIDPVELRAGIPYACQTVNLVTGQSHVYGLERGDSIVIRSAILGSSSMPGYFPPVKIVPGTRHVDGGLRDITPLSLACDWLRKQDDEDRELWLFMTSPLTGMPRWSDGGALSRILRTIGILANEVYQNDVATLFKRNDSRLTEPGMATVRLGEGTEAVVEHPRRYVRIKASVSFPSRDLGDSLDFNPDRIRAMIADGASSYIPEPTYHSRGQGI